MTLDRLEPGQRAVVREIHGDSTVIQRLYEMGLTEGEEVELVRRAPFGDPIEIRLRHYELSLRTSEARLVVTQPVDGA